MDYNESSFNRNFQPFSESLNHCILPNLALNSTQPSQSTLTNPTSTNVKITKLLSEFYVIKKPKYKDLSDSILSLIKEIIKSLMVCEFPNVDLIHIITIDQELVWAELLKTYKKNPALFNLHTEKEKPRKSQKSRSFDCEFFKEFYSTNLMKEMFLLVIDFLFCDYQIDLISKKLNFACCTSQQHGENCKEKWKIMKENLKSIYLSSLYMDNDFKRVLTQFFVVKGPKKEALSANLFRSLKKLIKHLRTKTIPKAGAIKPTTPPQTEEWNKLLSTYQKHTSELDFCSKVKDPQKSAKKGGFNNEFFRKFYSRDSVKEIFRDMIKFLFCDNQIELICKRLKFYCCTSQYHGDECRGKWDSMKESLENRYLNSFTGKKCYDNVVGEEGKLDRNGQIFFEESEKMSEMSYEDFLNLDNIEDKGASCLETENIGYEKQKNDYDELRLPDIDN